MSREILLRHARHPQRQGEIANADAKGECKNPLCGDHVQVTLRFDSERDKVSDIRILTSGCGISNASASLMTDLVQDAQISELHSLIERATSTISATICSEWPEDLNSLRVFESLRTNPRKIPCALIGWYALKNSLTSLNRSDELRSLSRNETSL